MDTLEIDGVVYQADTPSQMAGIESFVSAVDDAFVASAHTSWHCHRTIPTAEDDHTVIKVGSCYWRGPTAYVNKFLEGFSMVADNNPDINVQAVRISNAVLNAAHQSTTVMHSTSVMQDELIAAVRRMDEERVKQLLTAHPSSVGSAFTLAMRKYNKARGARMAHLLLHSGQVRFERALSSISIAAMDNASVTEAQAIELVDKLAKVTPIDRDVYEVMLRFDKLGWRHLMKVITALVR